MKKERFSTLMVFAQETTGTKIPSIMVLFLQAHSDTVRQCLLDLRKLVLPLFLLRPARHTPDDRVQRARQWIATVSRRAPHLFPR
jgi:hypothetical protein